jgi:asparaginyl-tRNA synthetase
MKLKQLLNQEPIVQYQKFNRVRDCLSRVGESVLLRGWVYRFRKSAKTSFLILKDGTATIQCTVSKENITTEVWNRIEPLYVESSVIALEGFVRLDERAPSGIEVQVTDLEILFRGEPFPINRDQSTEFLLDKRHLWVRSQRISYIMKFKHELMKICRKFLDDKGFIEIQPPLLTSSAAEGGAEVFEVKYFDTRAYLSQTGQLYSEAVIHGNPLVYVFAPSFRSDPSRTPRHLTEFWQLEPEMAWYDFDMNINLQEVMV